MSSINVLNTSESLEAKTIVTAEGNTTITGTLTFDRDPSAPFAVSANSAVVANLDADKVDGQEGSYYASAVTDVAFSAGNYTAVGGGSWTVASGDVLSHYYSKSGKMVTLNVVIQTSTVAGTVNNLAIALPVTADATHYAAGPVIIFNNSASVFECGRWVISPTGTTVSIVRPAGAAFSASTDLTYIQMSITYAGV